MKGQKTLSISVTSEKMETLEKGVNYLDTARRTFYLLYIYLWRNETLTEAELKTALSEIEHVDNKEVFISNLPRVYLELYKDKPLYFYSFNEYISALFHIKMEKGIREDRQADERVGKKNRIYYIQENILEDFVSFSKKIDVNQKTLINYAIMEDFHLKNNNDYLNENKNKIRKGIEFSYPSLEKFDEFIPSNRENIINKILYLIPILL